MAVLFATFNWTDFEAKIANETARLAKLVAGRAGQSDLEPECLLSEAMAEPTAANIESLMTRSIWYTAETTEDHAAYDAITRNLLTPPLGKEFKCKFNDDAYIDFTTLSVTTETIPPGTIQYNPFLDEMEERMPQVSLAEKCGLRLKSFPLVLGRRYRSEIADHGPDSPLGVHSPDDVAAMLDECKILHEALKKSKERHAASMADELEEGFLQPISKSARPKLGLYAFAVT